ncbi:MAG: NFACT RNA binding domain-containing protein [Holophagaceae bacterium]
MDAPLILALARAHLGTDSPGVQDVLVAPQGLLLQWMPRRSRGEGKAFWWALLLHPAPELWRLDEKDEAFQALKAAARKDESRRWGLELKGARLVEVEGDPRERWLGLAFQRRAITGRLEATTLAWRAIPGRSGLRLDGEPPSLVRLGLGQPFPKGAPDPDGQPPALERWRDRFGTDLDAALAGDRVDVLEGDGDLAARHRAWSLARAARILLAPKAQAVDRAREVELQRLERLRRSLALDRARHTAALPLKDQAARISAELYHLKGATGSVEFLDGSRLDLPAGETAETAARRWFAAAKKAERGLARLAVLEGDLARQWQAAQSAPHDVPAVKPKEKPRVKDPKETKPDSLKRKDGKGQAFRSVIVDGFEVLIGKGDADNDALTFKVAAPLDVWMHVASVPGSHVVIRNPDKLSELPREVLERAAQLAAWHSKARDGGKVEVHVCRVADVSKPRGFAPGKVLLRQFKGIRVYPKA